MVFADSVLHLFAVMVVVGFVGRASVKLLEDSEGPHDRLVPVWERRATTAVGVPFTLVGPSTMADGPLAAPYDPLMVLLTGIVLLVYPDFSPSAL